MSLPIDGEQSAGQAQGLGGDACAPAASLPSDSGNFIHWSVKSVRKNVLDELLVRSLEL